MSTRDALLDATRRVISRSGFGGTTVGEITREAGASLGLLHYHFESKDEVVAEAFAQAAREDLAELRAISLRHEDPADRLAAFLDQSEWQDAASWRLWVDAWGESVHSPLVRDTLGRFDVGWRAGLAGGVEGGGPPGWWGRCWRTASAKGAGNARTRATPPRGWWRCSTASACTRPSTARTSRPSAPPRGRAGWPSGSWG